MKNYINPDDLKNFAAKCDALSSSKLILSDNKISDILKVIASSEDFCKYIESCIKDFNYKTEFIKAKVPQPGKQDKFFLNLPENEKLVAFIFCLLCEFDNKQRDLTKFLTEFYGLDELFTDAFAAFCINVIVPFKNAILKLADEDREDEDELLKSEITFNTEIIIIPDNVSRKINKLCQELIRNIVKEPELKSEEREQYTLVVKAFISAMVSGDKKLIEVLIISLNFMCQNYKFLLSKVRQIEKIFEDENILKLQG